MVALPSEIGVNQVSPSENPPPTRSPSVCEADLGEREFEFKFEFKFDEREFEFKFDDC